MVVQWLSDDMETWRAKQGSALIVRMVELQTPVAKRCLSSVEMFKCEHG